MYADAVNYKHRKLSYGGGYKEEICSNVRRISGAEIKVHRKRNTLDRTKINPIGWEFNLINKFGSLIVNLNAKLNGRGIALHYALCILALCLT